MNETELLQFLARLHHQLNILKEREAKAGNNAPLDLLNQIDDHEQAITLVEATLAGKMSTEALAEQLEPLGLSLNRGGTEFISGDKVEGDKFEVEKSLVKVVIEGIPTRLLLGLLALVILMAYLAWIYLVPNKMPVHGFNVAVAEFGQVDAQGHVSPSEDGQYLSEWMFGELQAESRNLPAGQPINFWHDSMGMFKKREKIGLITGSTPAERNAAAKAVAERIGANMVIYGNIAVDENPVDFTPEFYVAAIRHEADELVGQHQLGSPIQVQLPIDLYDDRTSIFFEKRLGGRVDALVWFTRGLVHDLSGDHSEALKTFREAETELKNWDDDQGKDILYYFIGREALFLSNKDFNEDVDSLETEELLNKAEEAFKKALEINPNYTRGHIGLGGVYFQQAQQLSPEQKLQTDDLDLAIDHYKLAVEGAVNSAEPQVEIKGLLGLGLAHRLKGDAYLRTQTYDEAGPVYDLAIEEIESALARLSQDQYRLLAQAYLGLGAAYEGKAYLTRFIQQEADASKPLYEDARAAYEHCIEQADQSPYDDLLQKIKNYCDPYGQEVQKVLDGL
jgi:tetratricopeptide (TPR) repeat protein